MFLEVFSLTRWQENETWMQNYAVSSGYSCSAYVLRADPSPILHVTDLSEGDGYAVFHECGVRAGCLLSQPLR